MGRRCYFDIGYSVAMFVWTPIVKSFWFFQSGKKNSELMLSRKLTLIPGIGSHLLMQQWPRKLMVYHYYRNLHSTMGLVCFSALFCFLSMASPWEFISQLELILLKTCHGLLREQICFDLVTTEPVNWIVAPFSIAKLLGVIHFNYIKYHHVALWPFYYGMEDIDDCDAIF